MVPLPLGPNEGPPAAVASPELYRLHTPHETEHPHCDSSHPEKVAKGRHRDQTIALAMTGLTDPRPTERSASRTVLLNTCASNTQKLCLTCQFREE